MKARCTSCGAIMDNREFDQHDCPFSIDPADGESWEDFKSRADQWREYIRLIAKEEGRAMTEVALEMRPSLRG